MDPKRLLEKIGKLSSLHQQEAEDFIDQLASEESEGKSDPGPFAFDWAGALSEYKEEYTSVQLQKKILGEWR
jgi:hypothetical protein